MTPCYTYLRTSSDDGKEKAGLPVQRAACSDFAIRSAYSVASEYADDGITGKLPMAARPQGRLLIAALLGDGVKTVVTYDAKRIGRTEPAFWSFIGLCRDSGIVVFDATGTDLTGSVMGGKRDACGDGQRRHNRPPEGRKGHLASTRQAHRWTLAVRRASASGVCRRAGNLRSHSCDESRRNDALLHCKNTQQ